MIETFVLMKFELIVAAMIILLLIIKVGFRISNAGLLTCVQTLLLLNFLAGFFYNGTGNAFADMFRTNELVSIQKNCLNLGVYLISLLFSGWLQRHEHLPEFFILMLSALLGMFLMLSSDHFLMFYLSLELATIPVAAMVNFDLHKRESSEAAMKMIMSSALASGVFLFGISIIYGITGTLNFEEIHDLLPSDSISVLAVIFVFAGIAFKLSVVPFHLWTADVYEGAPVAVTSFLSVVSKAAIAFALITMISRVFGNLPELWKHLLMLSAVATLTIGNLFAIRQENFKRFLAFSSIAQVGFILVAMNAEASLANTAIIYFVVIYTFSNLAAFAVADLVQHQAGDNFISSFKGFYKSNPFLTWMLALALFSLAGIPPTAGFFGKLFLITTGAARANYGYITFVSLNLIVSLYYYLRVIKAMFVDEPERRLERIKVNIPEKIALFICASGILLLGFLGWIYEYISSLH